MKTHHTIPILAVLFILPVLALQTDAAAIQSDAGIFNITITASGGGNLTTGSSNFNLIIGEPVVGNTTTNTSQFSFGFFQSQKSLGSVTLTINQPPLLPIWINPTNNSQFLESNLILFQYSSSDPEGSEITYYVYQNDEFLRTSKFNISNELNNGSYNYTVAAYDGAKYSPNATVHFEVDVPLTTNIAWAIPVSMIYIASVAMFILYSFTIRDKQFTQLSNSSLIPREIVDSFINILKVIMFTTPFAMVLLGLHIARLIVQAASGPSNVMDSLELAFVVWMWISFLVIVTYFVLVFRESLVLILDRIKLRGNIKSFRDRGIGRRGQK